MTGERREKKSITRPLLIGAAIGLAGATLSALGFLSSWSHRATDVYYFEKSSVADSRIVVVAIDDASIQKIGRWPWHREVHANVIRTLTKHGASVIGYDVSFPEPEDEGNDNALSSAMIDSKRVVLHVELGREAQDREAMLYDSANVLEPIPVVKKSATRLGHANLFTDSDGVVRRVPLLMHPKSGDGPLYRAFAYEVADQAGLAPTPESIPRDSSGRLIINFPGAPHTAFPTVPVKDVLDESFDPGIFKDKIVLIGSTAPDLHDELLTPVSQGRLMPGVEIHASLVHTLLTRSWLMEAPSWIMAILLVFLGVMIGWFLPSLRARWGALLTIILWIGTVVGALIAFDNGIIVDIVWPTLVLGIAYTGVTLERRITAEIERREMKNLFSHYVSPSVVESILRDPSKVKLGGDRRRMTVFFSDIRGFTSISEKLQPEDLVEKLNKYLDRMTDLVFETDGVLDKYIGDAVMALWNAPFDQPDHAKRAVRTALAMRHALKEMNEAGDFGDYPIAIGMGINTGDMVVGNIGGKVHASYTVIGDNVNLASRLESLTKEYQVSLLTTQATVDELEDEFLCRKLDKVAVKGKKEPVTIYEVIDESSRATPEQKKLVLEYQKAYDAYLQKDFDGTLKTCQVLREKYPSDGPVSLLCEHAMHFKENPPPADWDGTWVYTKK